MSSSCDGPGVRSAGVRRPSDDGEGGGPSVSWSDGVIRLRDPCLFDPDHPASCRTFLGRVFRLGEIRSVEVIWADALAVIRYESTVLTTAGALARLATATRGEPIPDQAIAGEPTLPPIEGCRRVKFRRQGAILTTWDVVSEQPGRIRFRHEALVGDHELALRVEGELAGVHGVTESHARPMTGGLLVRFDPKAIRKGQLLQILDRVVLGPAEAAEVERHPPTVRFGAANGSVALAALGEFAVPALLPASAVLLVASNLKVIRAACRELRGLRLGLPVLFTVIIAGTLLSGQFLAAALMAWMVAFWRHRHRIARFQLRRNLLPPLTQRRRFARLLAQGGEVEVPIERLRGGDRILVDEWEMIPADGRLIGGPSVVDERLVRGASGLTRKESGETIFAGSWSVEGRIEVEVSGPAHLTRAARLGRGLADAAVSSPTGLGLTAHGEEFGQRAVGPTLAAAGIGLVIGDLTTASAILRPDYSTGPGLGVSLESLRDIAACAREGIVVRDASAFQRLASADVILFDHLPALERAGLKVANVLSLDGTHEGEILRLAATAFRDLADDLATALETACRLNRISTLDLQPGYRGSGVTLHDGDRCIRVQDARGLDAPADGPPPLDVSADGRVIGLILFGSSPGPRAAEAIRELRRDDPMTIGLLSDRADREIETLATSLGMDLHLGGLSRDAKLELLGSLRRRGLKVAYIGDCLRESRLAREAHVAISLAEELDLEHDAAQVLILKSDLRCLSLLLELSRSHVDRIRTVHGAILLPNLACIAGAFFLGFTSLSAVVLTNLGTLAIYSGLSRRDRLSYHDPSRSGVPERSSGSRL